MRTAIAPHELLPKGLQLESLSIGAGRVNISVASGMRRSRCPICARGSSRVHSRYLRMVSDLPWHGISVELEVRARRFFCDEVSCERKIFCERLPDVAARARKTGRLEEALLAIVFELGGRAGARLAAELGLVVGRDALLRRAKGAPLSDVGKVRMLGVDDFAFRKGHTYGTILVDLERRRIVDLLPERSQESLVAWLSRHPEIEFAARDRSNTYREALAKGAPAARQVADRWHLLHNLALTLEEFLLQKQTVLRAAASPEAAPEEKGDDAFSSGPIMPNRPRNHERNSEETCTHFVAQLRRAEANGKASSSVPRARRGSVAGLSPSAKNVAALLMRREEKLTEEQKSYLGRLCSADEALADARRLTQAFAEMTRNLEGGEKLDGWLGEAEASKAPAMRRFAAGLEKDLDAVRAGLTEEWSNGPVEGFVHKLKLLKRQGYGRAGFDLLRARMLAA